MQARYSLRLHGAGTAGDDFGDVSVAIKKAIDNLPYFKLEDQ